MEQPKTGEPWAYIAHRDGCWAGVTAANAPDVGKFLGGFARDGFAIMTVFNREEYNKALDGMEMWRHRKVK